MCLDSVSSNQFLSLLAMCIIPKEHKPCIMFHSSNRSVKIIRSTFCSGLRTHFRGRVVLLLDIILSKLAISQNIIGWIKWSMLLMAVMLSLTAFPRKEEKERLMSHNYYFSIILDHFIWKNVYDKRVLIQEKDTMKNLFYRPDADAGKVISPVHIA